jgi:hypothetical protein
MDKNIMASSYSDLFEDFFRVDSAQGSNASGGGGGNVAAGAVLSSSNDNLFKGFLNDTSNDMSMLQNDVESLQSYYMPQHLEQLSQPHPFYQQAQAQVPAFGYQHMIPPIAASVQKPGFIRNRARKNMRQKSVAAAVKASHMMAPINSQAGSGYPLMQMYQPTIPTVITSQIPYYQAAAQISAYQPPQQPQMILAKSPVTQSATPLMRSGNPSHLNSPARSPNSNSSDYVKLKLQQKIRSRMVSKGQIPPNPTEEELRLCGLQMPSSSAMLSNHLSQLPTPKQSPQIPRAFNNNAAAFVAAPVIIDNKSQGQQHPNEDYMKYLDLSGYSQKDPLMMSDTNMTMQSIKQQQQQGQLLQVPVQQQPDFSFPQQEVIQNNNNGSLNYDQFFSDFILY